MLLSTPRAPSLAECRVLSIHPQLREEQPRAFGRSLYGGRSVRPPSLSLPSCQESAPPHRGRPHLAPSPHHLSKCIYAHPAQSPPIVPLPYAHRADRLPRPTTEGRTRFAPHPAYRLTRARIAVVQGSGYEWHAAHPASERVRPPLHHSWSDRSYACTKADARASWATPRAAPRPDSLSAPCSRAWAARLVHLRAGARTAVAPRAA